MEKLSIFFLKEKKAENEGYKEFLQEMRIKLYVKIYSLFRSQIEKN